MLGIVAFIGIFVATYYAYKSAKDYGRNPFLWAFITFAVGFGLQVIVPLLFGIVYAAYLVVQGTAETELEAAIQTPVTIVSFISMILSVIGMLLILKYLGTVPDDVVSENTQPPQPPVFDQ